MANPDRFLQDNGTLRNRLGITDAEALTRAESDLSLRRILQLQKGTAPEETRGRFDLAHLKAIHRHIF